MKTRIFLIALAAIVSCQVMQAQSIWASAEASAKITKAFGVYVEAEYRTHDKVSSTERWAGTLGLEYKALPYLKLSGGYAYIHQHTLKEVTKKGNIIPPYWQPRHRAFFALTGSIDWNRFSFSLRERYQYTYRTGQSVPKFDSDGVTPKSPEVITSKGKHILRSRLEVEYKIKKSKFTPYISYEIYNSLTDGFAVDKSRYTIGSSYKINKKHSVSLYYRYQDSADEDDEDSGHIIGVGYKFKL